MSAIDVPPSVAEANAATLAAARSYIERGWHPVALHGVRDDGRSCTCPKAAQCLSGGKHPLASRWQAQAVPDLSLWDRYAGQRVNVGLVTGPKSDLWVVDCDYPKDQPHQRQDLPPGFLELKAAGQLVDTLCSRTGSSGLHLLYALPDDFTPSNRDKAMPANVDVRGEGGMIVVAPSISAKGPYRWIDWGAAVVRATPALEERIRPAVRLAPARSAPQGQPARARAPSAPPDPP